MASGLSIPIVPLAIRRVHGVKTVSSGAVNRTIPQPEFCDVISRIQAEAAARCDSMPQVVDGLWRAEGFATTFGKYRLPENTLADPRIPKEAWGIVHVGYGAATAEYTEFQPDGIHEVAEQKCVPACKGFLYEGTGSTLRIYEPGFFRWMCGVLKLIPKNAVDGPDREGFFASYLSAFDDEQQRLIAHGYGRLVAFSRISVHRAIEEAIQLPERYVEPCVMGIGFAFSMMNAQEMPRILANSEVAYKPGVRTAFQRGLVYALVFCDWFAPGFLSRWKAQNAVEDKLVSAASGESRLNQTRGYPLAFRLEDEV